MTVERPSAPRPELDARALSLAYDDAPIVRDLDLTIAPGAMTAIVGANACGKSTLLRGLSRLLAPASGAVYLDGHAIHTLPARTLARRMGLLPQTPAAPEGITVADLVARGRYPHQGWFRRWSEADEVALQRALAMTGVTELADRPVDALSGGQRQRVWIAMTLAQDTELVLLDEPTTYLDITHQIEVLDLLTDLVRGLDRTVVLVLHDLNLAARYADRLVAMRAGRIIAEGPPATIVTPDIVEQVFGLRCQVVPDPVSGTPMVVPIGRHHTR